MTKNECSQLIESYIEWLRKGLSVEALENACELTTPFLDRHNDHLQVYAVKENGKVVLSDDGYILADLRTSGLEVNTAKRKAVLESLLNGFGVKSDGTRLWVETSAKNLGQRLHSLVQAMLAVNDMFVLAQPHVASFFWEDVKEFLAENQVRFSSRVRLSGRSGFDHAIDFLIPRSNDYPERLIQVINAPRKNTITAYLFALADTRQGRDDESEAYAFLNDQDKEIGGEVIEALEQYEVKPALWSHRAQHIQALAN